MRALAAALISPGLLTNSPPIPSPTVFLKTTVISTRPSFRSLLFTNVFSSSTFSSSTRSTFTVPPLAIPYSTFTQVRIPRMYELLECPDSLTGVTEIW